MQKLSFLCCATRVWFGVLVLTWVPQSVLAQSMTHADDVEEVEAVEVQSVGPAPLSQFVAQSDWYDGQWPRFDRVVDAFTARTTRRASFNTLISHRNYGGFGRHPFDTFLGFDAGMLKVGLGLRYGILDNLDVGVFRLSGGDDIFNTYEFDVRYQLLQQASAYVDVAIRAGMTWFSLTGPYSDSVAPFVMILADHLFWNRLLAGINVIYHSDSSGPDKIEAGLSGSAAVQVYGDFRLVEWVSIALEVTQTIAGYHQPYPNVTFGPRFITHRHSFAIALSNTRYSSTDGIVTNNDRSHFLDWVLGFSITREF